MRRLLAAATVSLSLHLLLTRGLAVTTLRLDAARLAPAVPLEEKTQRPRADVPLEVRKSSPPPPPAHERPLDLPLPSPPERPRPPPVPERTREVAERRPEETKTSSPEVRAETGHLAPSRPLDAALAAAAPSRFSRAAASTAIEPQAHVEPLAAAAAADADAKPPVAEPAPAIPRAAEPAPPIASRWRPREVALLDRLGAPVMPTPAAGRPADATALSIGQATPMSRRTAEPVAPTAAVDPLSGPVASVPAPPPARAAVSAMPLQQRATAVDPSRASATAPRTAGMNEAPQIVAILRPDATRMAGNGAATRSLPTDDGMTFPQPNGAGRRAAVGAATIGSVDAAVATVSGPPVAASFGPADAVAGQPSLANAAPQSGGRPQSSAAPAVSAGTTQSSAQRDLPLSSPGSAQASTAASIALGNTPSWHGRDEPGGSVPQPIARSGVVPAPFGDGDRAVAVAPPPVLPSAPSAGVPTAEAAGAVPAPQPLARRDDRPASVSAARRQAAMAPSDADDEELSVAVPRITAISAGPALRAAAVTPAALPAARLERLAAAAALPGDGRVRDVAEAFARRVQSRPQPAPGTAAETADRLVDRGLEFLVRSQQTDGRWSLGRFAGVTADDAPRLQSDTAATGLALLSFLGAGHDHYGGPHADTVRRGLEYLLAVQKADGDFYVPADDLSNSCAWLYSHGIASIAVCEALGMTGDPRIRPAAERACRFIAASQHPERGGWRYVPGTDADLSVSGWMLVALRSGELAGLRPEPEAVAGVRRLVEAAASTTAPARYAYNPRSPQQRPSVLSMSCMTAVGGLMRLHTGEGTAAPGVKEPCRTLARLLPAYGTPTSRTRDAYLWYYASQLLVHDGGPDWDRWYAALVETLAARQETSGVKAGSWDPLGAVPDRWGIYGGRLYVTALHLLALEVPARHLPTYGPARRP